MKNFRRFLPALAAVTLLSLPAKTLSQQTVSGTFTTIDFPGAVDTVECCSATLNINEQGQIVGGYADASGTGQGFLGVPFHQRFQASCTMSFLPVFFLPSLYIRSTSLPPVSVVSTNSACCERNRLRSSNVSGQSG